MMDAMAQRREELEQYLLGAVTPERQAEVKALLEQDAVWQQVYQQLLQEKQGIRFNALTRLKQKLSAYEESLSPEEKYFENISVDAGDLSMVSAPPGDRPTKQTEVATSMTPTPAEPDDLTRQGIRYHALRRLKDQLEDAEKKFSAEDQEVDKNKIIRMRPWVKWLGIAASVLVVSYFTWLYFKPPTLLEQLEAQGYVKPEMQHLYRGPVEDSIQMLIQKAYGAYAMEDYKTALRYFKEIPTQRDSFYLSYYAYSLIYLNERNLLSSLMKKAIDYYPENKSFRKIYYIIN